MGIGMILSSLGVVPVGGATSHHAESGAMQDRRDQGGLFDNCEWTVRKTIPIDFGDQFKKSTATLLSSVSPKGESGTGNPLYAVELLIVNDAHHVIYRFSEDLHEPDFFADETLQAKDVTGDGIPELLFHSGVVGASDWLTHEHVIYRRPGSSFAQDIALPEFVHSWRHTFRWISFRGTTLALVADPLNPQNPDDPHACHSCNKFYQYLVFKWERDRETFVLLRSIQSEKEFDANTDPLAADLAFIRARLSKECQ